MTDDLTADRGLLLGDGVFETLLALDGRMVDWEPHLARMTRACLALGLPAPDPSAARAAAEAALSAAGPLPRAAVRLTLTAGDAERGLDRPAPLRPRFLVRVAAAPVVAGPAAVMLASVRRNTTSPTSRFKTLSYLDNVLARVESRVRGADEAVLLNERGELACASAANLFWLKDRTLFTPALDCGVLDGIERGKLMQAAQRSGLTVAEVHADAAALADADACFLASSLIGVRPIGWFDGRPLPVVYVEQILAVGGGVSVPTG